MEKDWERVWIDKRFEKEENIIGWDNLDGFGDGFYQTSGTLAVLNEGDRLHRLFDIGIWDLAHQKVTGNSSNFTRDKQGFVYTGQIWQSVAIWERKKCQQGNNA